MPEQSHPAPNPTDMNGKYNQKGTIPEPDLSPDSAMTALLRFGVTEHLAPGPDREMADSLAADGGNPGDDFGHRLWELTDRLASRWVQDQTDTALTVAVGALLGACRLMAEATEPGSSSDRFAAIDELLADADPRISLATGGPLVVTGTVGITDHLGTTVETSPVAVLCRCGQSRRKPACDASCWLSGFDDQKDPARIPDRRDTYEGLQVTVLDNRGICQHSGLCTDRLASVFHAGSDPFVTASGGRMDEVIRAVRDCPSGALSYAIDGEEARAQTDWDSPGHRASRSPRTARIGCPVRWRSSTARATSPATRDPRESTMRCVGAALAEQAVLLGYALVRPIP